ncbi:MAG: Serine protease [Candidatus Collierbacteria bacterium GW2011_GWA2_46_26]|uniref:Serine protease n=1 Tax=Candidatus Collierbacteria bacterium GW2011_GWA2_46_26 TaxID=1618381 RepID=A0A0G1PMJ2_9BACT|nr:MAG: Serine protease [Candidatus Collierbacteria bacterium GW2011_GWC2_44_13]KKU33912.1 MAG: Serine protease [Candidatus Collierbacteria bacterium GW2011_GWA2_46_26]
MKKAINFVLSLASGLLITSSMTLMVRAQGRDGVTNGNIPDSYIVVFHENVTAPEEHANGMARKYGLGLTYIYSHAIKGFSATIPAVRLEQIKKDPSVKFISQDRMVSADVHVQGKPNPSPVPQPTQVIPNGIKRIGRNTTDLGTNIGVAVIDTGIDLKHPDLIENIKGNITCVNRTTTGNDDNGHGTHVAGTIAARDNAIGVIGVAPEANLYAVKVLDKRGSGSWSSVICGIDWVTKWVKDHPNTIQVANMSLGGSGNSDKNCGNTDGDALHQAICRSRDAGITYVVAAGNEKDDAANHVPAAYDDAVITVSALVDTDGLSGGLGSNTNYGNDDTFASFSNFSPIIVDLGAPGVSIHSTWKGGAYNTISGTSMATPHVAGAAALYILNNPQSSWVDVKDGLISSGEANGFGHTDPSLLHPEVVLRAGNL